MRHLIITFVHLFLLSALAIPSASASDDSQIDYIVTLSDDTDDEDRDNKPETGEKGRRDFIWSTTCRINPDRIDIPSIDKESIISYDIYDQYGLCIGSFFYESDFLSALFTIKGKLKIRIVLETFSLSGYLEIP
ncbi:MAG: hypothetical protein K2G29_07340 [Muribaculaceae bacterium]|nr:hypothetical protein [Muribaculaceae bacterium]MDE6423711.1 hypothetical protein [Muribaculaceae bacterium]